MNPDQKKRLTELFTAHAENSLTAEQHEELQTCLRNDAEARRWWFLHQDVEIGLRARVAALTEAARWSPVLKVTEPTRTGHHTRGRIWRPLAAAVAALLLSGGMIRWFNSPPRQPDMAAALASTQQAIAQMTVEPPPPLPSWMSPTDSVFQQLRLDQ